MTEIGSAAAKRMCCMPERAMVHTAMTVLQFCYAGNLVIQRYVLNMGASTFVFPLYRNITALALLAPFAYFSEKKKRPALTASILVQLFILGLLGVTLNQGLYLVGLNNTSPTSVAAIENSVPAITFVMAAIFRVEQVNLKRKDGIAKVLGTIASVAGASVMTLYKGPTIYSPNPTLHQQLQLPSLGDGKEKNQTLGCIFIISHCLAWSSWSVFQSKFLRKYPAQLSVTSFTCFFAILQLWAIAALFETNSQAWLIHSSAELFAYFYTGAVGSGFIFIVLVWVIERAGPVFVSVYLPLQTIIVAVISSIAFGEEFYLGGIIGAVLIIAGLYMVIWGKSEEAKFAMEKIAILSVVAENERATSHDNSSLIQPLLNITSSKS